MLAVILQIFDTDSETLEIKNDNYLITNNESLDIIQRIGGEVIGYEITSINPDYEVGDSWELDISSRPDIEILPLIKQKCMVRDWATGKLISWDLLEDDFPNLFRELSNLPTKVEYEY